MTISRRLQQMPLPAWSGEQATDQRDRGYSQQDTPVSHSATRGAAKGLMTPGTSGRGFIDSLPNFRPTDRIGLFSRMFVATSAWGSTVCSMTWKASATPRGRSLYLLRVSARSTVGTECGSSDRVPTPQSRDFRSGQAARWENHVTTGERTGNLNDWAAAMDRTWPTPKAQDAKHGAATQWELTNRNNNGDLHVEVAKQNARMWPTPTGEDAKNLSNSSRSKRNTPPLAYQVVEAMTGDALTMWPTPTANCATGPSNHDNLQSEVARLTKDTNPPDTVLTKPLYPTPDASMEKFRLSGDSQQSRCLEALARLGKLDGTSPRSGQRLNPAFVERLMGFPPGWTELE